MLAKVKIGSADAAHSAKCDRQKCLFEQIE